MMNQARVPSDPGVLAHLGRIANKQGDESQVCDYLDTSPKQLSSHLELGWTGMIPIYITKNNIIMLCLHYLTVHCHVFVHTV